VFRAACAHVSPASAGRLLVTLLALLLLVSVEGVVPLRVEAGSPHGVALIRERQLRAERSMRRADRQITRLERRHDHHSRRFQVAARRLERSIVRRDAARERLERIRARLAEARAVRDRELRVHPSPTGRQRADRPGLRRHVHSLHARAKRPEARAGQLERRIDRLRRAKQVRAHHAGAARIEARRQAREHAESMLGSQIGVMLALAKERAAERTSSRATRGFLRPARGRVSQGYGCQAVRKTHGRHVACGRFHDGIDIATAPGASVRASADGYVAYVGWNPWDRGRRAYVVIIGHARDLETIYAHLKPVSMVRAGQHVRRGQRIGQVGLTGHTSGPHVHWEVSRDFRTMDPRSVRR
jgi:murein DD-endopeptidase MepM/ murein hydrolase activator NlpD